MHSNSTAEAAVVANDTTQPFLRSVSEPPRLIHQVMGLENIPKIDQRFYRSDGELSRRFVELEPIRRAYIDNAPNLILALTCIDEREQDFEKTTGIPVGAANVLQFAGNKIGDVNLALCTEIQSKIDKASKMGKSVLLLFVTHESHAHPETDSCAAWKQSIRDADAYATLQVERFCRDYVDRDADGSIVNRYLTSFHIKSVTDTEAKIWVADDGARLDPMEYVCQAGHPMRATDALTKAALEDHIFDRLIAIYPFGSWRFVGFTETQWTATLSQVMGIIVQNVTMLREIMRTPHRVPKNGHKGTRALVGRGWEMYDDPNKYFKVGDFAPDFRDECRIAAKYIVRNGLLRKRRRFGITFHVNVLYTDTRLGDRSGSIRYAMDLARTIKKDLTRLFRSKRSRKRFDESITAALHSEGVNWADLPQNVHDSYRKNLSSNLRIYVSVSTRKSRALELVASIEDL